MDYYLTNDYVKAKGKFKYPCPYKNCNEEIPFYQLVVIFSLFRKLLENKEWIIFKIYLIMDSCKIWLLVLSVKASLIL